MVKKEEGNKLVSDFERLLDSSTLADVKIKCEGKVVECHKAILSARYFDENIHALHILHILHMLHMLHTLHTLHILHILHILHMLHTLHVLHILHYVLIQVQRIPCHVPTRYAGESEKRDCHPGS